MKNTKRSSFLELLRFIFCLVIFLHHSGFFASDTAYPFKTAGFYGVEFFFILTGALSMRHVNYGAPSIGCMKYSVDYTFSKLKRVFPYALIGVVLAYAWFFVSAGSKMGPKDMLIGRFTFIYEILFLPMAGVMDVGLHSYMNSPLWYLSVLLFVLPVVVYLAVRFRDVFNNYLCWVLPLFIYAYLIEKFGTIGSWGAYTGVFYTGILRGLAGLVLGCAIYILSTRISIERNFLRVLATIFEVCTYIFALMAFNSNLDGYAYEFAILVMGAGMAFSLSNATYTANIDSRLLIGLGSLSLPIYCLHWPVYRWITFVFENNDIHCSYIGATSIALAITFVLAAVSKLIIDNLRSKKS